MHRQMRYRHEYWSPYSNEIQWLNNTELQDEYMERLNVYNRITDFFYRKRRQIFDQARYAEAMRIRRAINVGTPLGMFQVLPRELLYNLFDRIPVKFLLPVSLTSNTFNSEVRRYLLLESAHQKFLVETATCVEGGIFDVDPFYSWGMLLKASTIVMNSRKRRSFLASFFSKNEEITNWPGWGRCFMAFCEKWDFHECEELMHVILHFTELNQFLHKILSEKIGKYPSLEMQVRARLRALFLSHAAKDGRDYGFWISAILRTQKTVELQGKLFMVMFGPVKTTENEQIIDWEVLCDGSISLRHRYMKLLGSITLGFHHLANTSSLKRYAWTDYQIFTLFEQISKIPNTWALHNIAMLLILRPKFIHKTLLKLLAQGRTSDAAHLFHALKTVLYDWGILVSAAMSDVMLETFRDLSPIDRRLFLGSILRTESYQLCELLLSTPFDAESFHDELSCARSISALMELLARNI
ncbi:hypothetical protein ACH3XW_37875 [Acanthocheilonema viteae]